MDTFLSAAPAPLGTPITSRLEAFLQDADLPTPVLVVDVAAVVAQYRALRGVLPDALVYYAVKANPLGEIVRALAAEGSRFDVASAAEIRHCLELGVPVCDLSFGHTVKKASAIAEANAAGIDLFACDSIGELRKIARHAPGARVMVRLLTDGTSAEWPLSRKFGCDPAMARALLLEAARLDLRPWGISFHVGSQQTDPGQWAPPVALAADLFGALAAAGIELQALNIGGGFPARYIDPVQPIECYAAAIERAIDSAFGRVRPQLILEPGRYLVADAGVIQAEVVLISRKSRNDSTRWVYIDCGKFGGLAETLDEAIKYRLRVAKRSGALTRVILAGPTCDSADILYERTDCRLPADLEEGDRVDILSAGAYTHTYASVGFNGFAPLRAVCI
jgi:ornithine decarboxylase